MHLLFSLWSVWKAQKKLKAEKGFGVGWQGGSLSHFSWPGWWTSEIFCWSLAHLLARIYSHLVSEQQWLLAPINSKGGHSSMTFFCPLWCHKGLLTSSQQNSCSVAAQTENSAPVQVTTVEEMNHRPVLRHVGRDKLLWNTNTVCA